MIKRDSASGLYVAKWTTGTLAATLAADAPIAAIRNGPTGNGKRVFISRVDIVVDILAAFTAGQQFGFYLQRFTGANLGGGAVSTPMKVRSADPASACVNGGPEAGDCRVATTGALTTAGVVFDGASGVSIIGWSAPGSATHVAGYGFQPDLAAPDYFPFELLPGDGLGLRNLVVWPAAGTAVVTASVYWFEA